MANATFAQYEATAARIWRLWGASLHEDPKNAPAEVRPKAVRDWDGPGRHAIVWEDCSPYEWAYLLGGGKDEEFGFSWKPVPAPKGYYFEPYYSFVVTLAEK